jgi:ferritin-like metal-binding protein YciE
MTAAGFGPVLDSALLDAARKVEHYEITAYRGAIAKAHELGRTEVATLLETNLQEEELTDYRLQQMAEGMMPYSGPGADPRDDGSEVIVGDGQRATV